ncbi:MAG: hypothetical protein HS110_15135 [Zoogloeaceae bacterium]|nr:hypothetical protein [Zoogloeaceae bacterium]
MISSVDFLSRWFFESRQPSAGEAAISIGDPDQDAPPVLGQYGDRALRVQFLDIEPEICWKQWLDVNKCLTPQQAEVIAGFLRRIHAHEERIGLIVHCEAGVSRSAAVALAAVAYARCGRRERDASFANTHVTRLLGDALGVNVIIPPPLEIGADSPLVGLDGRPLW